jgi:phage baseplate assembly protein W
MPVERTSKGFKDVSLTFKRNPLNKDIVSLTFKRNPLNKDMLSVTNETAISRAVRNLILTKKGERFFDLEFGTNVSNLLFENIGPFAADSIRDEIISAIRNYEPRVEIVNDTDIEVVGCAKF